jgi:ABC-type multidrug transport system permease subunit
MGLGSVQIRGAGRGADRAGGDAASTKIPIRIARMKRLLAIGHTDLRLFLKHKSAYVWFFFMPLAFAYIMGFSKQGPGDPYNHNAQVLIENEDTNYLGRIFFDELSSQHLWLLDPTNREAAARVIRIPADFTSRVLSKEQSRVQYLKRDTSDEIDTALIEARLVRALIAMNGHLLEAATATNEPGTISEGKLREIMAGPNMVSLNARFAGRKPVPSGFNFSLPGNLVMFLVMNLLIFGGATVAAERRNGVIKRLMACPVTRLEIVLGKIYGLMLLGLVQILFLLAAGKFLFHVNLGANLPAVTLTLVLLAWVAGSLGVLVGSLVAAPDRVNGICVLASLLMAALGGCWWPLEIGPPSLKTVSLCVPTGWALRALHQLISFGSDFSAVLIPLAVLLAFGVAANVLAARFFKN